MPQPQFHSYLVPLAIVIAGAIVAAALYFGGASFSSPMESSLVGDQPSSGLVPAGGENIPFRPIDPAKDHIKGDLNAAVSLIEYSDLECPFCKRFHPTLQQAVAEYEGKVNWAYRHFPLAELHSKATKEAEATECANELGGNDAFWAYVDRLFELTPSNDGLATAQLPQIAQDIGLDQSAFEQCLASGKYASRVAEDLADAMAAGGDGTPYTIVVAPNGKTFPISGAQPYASIKAVIELALKEQ